MMPDIKKTHLVAALEWLRCPACRTNLPVDGAGELVAIDRKDALHLKCRTCDAGYPVVNGVIDFLPGYETRSEPGLAQWCMENRFVVRFYEQYFRPAFTRMGSPIRYDEEIRWLKGVLPEAPVNIIMDLACGTGKYSRILNDHLSPERVFAIDISMPMLQKAVDMAAQAGADNIVHIRSDAGVLPLKDRCINSINCFGALHLFPDTDRTITEISRIAANKACFTCLTARKLMLWRPVQIPFSKLFSFHFFDETWMQDRLVRAGFHNFQKSVSRMVLMFACTRKTAS